MTTYIIDAGHGKDTPGKRSPNGLFREWLFNRKVAALVVEVLQAQGREAVLVVPDDGDMPLTQRVAKVNALCAERGADKCLLVSIHANAAGDGSRWMNAQGWSAYTTKGETRADALAECMYDSFQFHFPGRRIRKDMSDGDRDWEENFYILRRTACPAVLLENFFYDNLEECEWLLREDTPARIAQAVVDGLTLYNPPRL